MVPAKEKASAPLADTDETMSTLSGGDSIEDNAAFLRAPKGFLCPLTMEVMFEPVLDAEGNTYERMAILEWLKQHPTSPVSRQPLSERMLNPNNSLREAIHEFMGDAWVKRRSAKYTQCQGINSTRPRSTFRGKINCFLQLACLEIEGLPSSLSEKGCCAFRHEGIVMAMDVPESVGVFCLYTRSLVSQLTEPMKDLLLELNFLQGKVPLPRWPYSTTSTNTHNALFIPHPRSKPTPVVAAYLSKEKAQANRKLCFLTPIGSPKLQLVTL